VDFLKPQENKEEKKIEMSFDFEQNESVLCMEWCRFPDVKHPVLCVGTGFHYGEERVCRGRVLVFILDGKLSQREPAFMKRVKGPIMTMKMFGPGLLAYSVGFKLGLHKWENDSLSLVTYHEAGFCITSLNCIKNYMAVGDIQKGVEFVRFYDNALTKIRQVDRLSRSAPSNNGLNAMPILNADFVLEDKNLGIAAVDHYSNLHLFQYIPQMEGRESDQVLRNCASFQLGTSVRPMQKIQCAISTRSTSAASNMGPKRGGKDAASAAGKNNSMVSLFMAGKNGSMMTLIPTTDSKFRIVLFFSLTIFTN